MKKLISLVLACLMLVACISATAESAAPYGGPLDPFPETVTVKVMREFNSDIWFPEGENVKKNIITDFYKEKLNVEYDVAWEVERDTMEQQINLGIASDDLPDIFVATSNQIYRMAEAGMIQPLTEVWETYASENCKEQLGMDGGIMFNPVTIDGEIYGMPCPDDAAMFLPLLWVRQDWLDRLGISDFPINTVDDIVKLAKIFMAADMDGNGVDDTIGITFDNTLTPILNGIGHQFGQYSGQYVELEDGTLTYGDIQDGMKDLVTLINGWYKDGLLDKEFPTKDRVKTFETLANGKTGIYFHGEWVARSVGGMSYQNDPNARWVSRPIPARASDGKYAVGSEAYTDQWIVVNANFKYPEVAVKQHNLWYELWQGQYATWFHGLAGNEYNMAGEDFKYYPPFWWDPPYKNLAESNEFYDAWSRQDPSGLWRPETLKQYNRSTDFFMNKNTSVLTGFSNITKFYLGLQTVQKVYHMENVCWDAYTGPTTDVIASNTPLCKAVRDEWLTKFIVGAEDIETGWPKFVQEWLNAGGTELLEEVNNWKAGK